MPHLPILGQRLAAIQIAAADAILEVRFQVFIFGNNRTCARCGEIFIRFGPHPLDFDDLVTEFLGFFLVIEIGHAFQAARKQMTID